MARLALLFQIAVRNLFASKMNLIIGFIMLAGTALVIVGGALFDSLNDSMSRSVIGSVAGHLQIYSSQSKDELSLFGDFGGQESDLEPITDFPAVKAQLEELPHVRMVVPMGMGTAMVTSGNIIDLTLADLRGKLRQQAEGKGSPTLAAEVDSMKSHVREMARLIRQDMIAARVISTQSAQQEQGLETIDRVLSDAFWADFDRAPLEGMEFLENKLAQLLTDGDWLVLRYTGTDLDAFKKAFDRMELVEGTMPPRGQRGLLIPKFYYEELFKVKVARRLDLLKEAVEVNQKLLAEDPDLQRRVKELPVLTRDIMMQLDPLKQRTLVTQLQQALGSEEKDAEKLLKQLLTVNDQNLMERHRLFYELVAPKVELYRLRVGDTVSLQSASGGSGYMSSTNVKLWGTFQFQGLEKSPLAGVTSLIDLVSFQDLYGYLTPEKRAEIQALQKETGAQQVAREDAEAALFGGGAALVAEGESANIDEAAELGTQERAAPRTTYTEEDISGSVVLNAAVMLDDSRFLADSQRSLQGLIEEKGLQLKVMNWQQAAGFLGQLTLVAKMVLYVAVFIIFVVAIVIINNAMMMATMQRVREIGTLRAIGSRKGFILSMILVETAVLGAAFGALGALLGAGIMRWLGQSGIPASNEQLYFFFSGPRLFPALGVGNVIAGLTVVLVVSAISTLYPAYLATRVSPVNAMQAAEE